MRILIAFALLWIANFSFAQKNDRANPDKKENETNTMKRKENLDELLASGNTHKTLSELHNFISNLCGWGKNMDQLTEPQQNLYYNLNLTDDMDTGGFIQYFINSGGNFAHETVTSLRAVGAHGKADIVQAAIDLFPNKRAPSDRDTRTEVMEKIERVTNPKWENLDVKFHESKENLDSLNLEYIRKYSAEF